MIIVENQFCLAFNIGGKSDIIQVQDLYEFTLVEEAGNIMPHFKLRGKVSPAIVKYLNEANNLEVTLGTTPNDVSIVSLFITGIVSAPNEQSYDIACEGMLARPGYFSNCRTGITDKKTALEVIRSIAERYFEFDTNVSATDDSQYWIQYGISDRQFLQQVWMRSYITSSWSSVAVTHQRNQLRYYDMSKKAKEAAKWRFSTAPQGNEILVQGSSPMESSAAFQNAYKGYAPGQRMFDTQEATDTKAQAQVDVLLAPRAERPKRDDITTGRIPAGAVRTANMHAHYHEAIQTNEAHNSIFSGFGIQVQYVGKFNLIAPLDRAFYSDPSISATAEFIGGDYFVSKVVRTFSGMSLVTRVHLTREAPGLT